MTVEAWNLVQQADVIVMNINDFAAREVILTETDADVIDFSDEYSPTDAEKRYGTYFYEFITTLEHGYQNDGLVVNISVGHPCVWSYVTHGIKTIGEEYWNLDIELHPGISAVTDIYATLGLDPVQHGVQELSLPSFVMRDVTVSPDMLFIGWLVGLLEQDTNDPAPFETVVEQLSQCGFDMDTTVYLVRASNAPYNDSAVRKFPLHQFTALADEPRWSIAGTTLVIPQEELPQDIDMRRFTEEQRTVLQNPPGRDDPWYPEAAQSRLQESGEDELLEFISRLYTDYEFYLQLRESPENVLKAYDFTDEQKELILSRTHQKERDFGAEISTVCDGDA